MWATFGDFIDLLTLDTVIAKYFLRTRGGNDFKAIVDKLTGDRGDLFFITITYRDKDSFGFALNR